MANLERLRQAELLGQQKRAGLVAADARIPEREQQTIQRIGATPEAASKLDPVTLFEATYSSDELKNIPAYQQALLKQSGERSKKAYMDMNQADADLTATHKPTASKLRILEDAIRIKSGMGEESIGTSDLGKELGISGYATLMQSLDQRGNEIGRTYNSFVDKFSTVSQSLKDQYNVVADRYDRLQKKYDKEVARFDKIAYQISAQEHAMKMLDRQDELNKEAKKWAIDNPDAATALKLDEAGKKWVDGKVVTKGSLEDIKNSPGSSLVGDYQRLFIGSPLNKAGLDLAAPIGTPVKNSVRGTVEFAGVNGNWGNQVRIKDAQGNIHQYSHLNDINPQIKGAVGTNTNVETGAFVGGMGNTGKVLGANGEKLTPAQIKVGRGSHLDYTVYKPDGTKYTVQEAAKFAGIEAEPTSSSALTSTQISEVNKLAKEQYGATTIKTKDGYKNFVKPLLDRRAGGETIDEIADSLRFKGQSIEFTGTIRDAAQQITSDLTTSKTEIILDKLDDLVASKDQEKVRAFLKKIAIENSAGGVEQAKMIMSQERTVEFLGEIEDDLKTLEDNGVNTNIFTGTLEDAAKAVGTVSNAEMRKIATKILKARQQYRKSMTGVAFGKGENAEYDAMFPAINKTANFNTATIQGLKEAFEGDVDFFYGFAMGKDAYEEIFKNKSESGKASAKMKPIENLSSSQKSQVEKDIKDGKYTRAEAISAGLISK